MDTTFKLIFSFAVSATLCTIGICIANNEIKKINADAKAKRDENNRKHNIIIDEIHQQVEDSRIRHEQQLQDWNERFEARKAKMYEMFAEVDAEQAKLKHV